MNQRKGETSSPPLATSVLPSDGKRKGALPEMARGDGSVYLRENSSNYWMQFFLHGKKTSRIDRGQPRGKQLAESSKDV